MVQLILLLLSGLVGLGAGQSAYLNVVVSPYRPVGMTFSATSAPALRSTGLCDIVLSFLDGDGNPLKTSEVWIDPGHSASLKLDSDDFKGRRHGRKMFYAEIVNNSSDDGACHAVGTLELTDPNGRASAVIPLQETSFANPSN
jgi:hypothetical protein